MAIAKLAPNDELYASTAFAIRHMLGDCFAKGVTTIDAAVVAAESDRFAALLASQVAIVFQQPSFQALERAWYGLDTLVRYESRARTNVVTCTEDELRDNAPVLLTWLRNAVREKNPYAAVLLAFDLDLNESPNQCVMEQLAVIAADVSIPIFVGISAAGGSISRTQFLVPLTYRSRVRSPYGDEDGHLHARGFPFHEPLGGPPAANWVTGIPLLAWELGFGKT